MSDITGLTMTFETPTTFHFKTEDGREFLAELDGGRWILRGGKSPNLGHAKIERWEIVKRALQEIERTLTEAKP